MTQQTINTGTVANDGTGDQLKDAFDKTEANFTEIYTGTSTVVRQTAPTLPHGVTGDLQGMIAQDATYVYVCTADYVDNATIIWKRVALPAPAAAVTW